LKQSAFTKITAMKQTLLTILAGLLFLARAEAQVSLPFYDGFSYGTGGDLAGNGSWTVASGSGTIKVNAGNLSYAGLQDSAGNDVALSVSGTAGRTALNFATQSSGTLYVSFLLKINATPSAQRIFGYVHHSTSSSSSPDLGFFVNSTPQLLVGLSTSSPQFSANVTAGSTYLVVVGYTFGTTSDSANVWVNPGSLGGSAPTPNATFTGTHRASLTHFLWNTVGTSSDTGRYEVDELRIGTNWASVTPANGTVPPPTLPVVTNAWMTTNGFVMRGTNGTAGAEYGVMTTPVLPQPMDQWTLLAKYYFDANGNFDCTNPLPAGSPQQFYRLQVGNLPVLPVAPVITNQPQNRTVAEGQNTSFSAGASGTAPLRYQWYFSPDTLLAGKTNATLSLSTVTANQSGGYFVIVTNVAGAATSTVATLTVTSAPPVAPTITTQPQNQSVNEGDTATFSVVATGTPPLSYRWFFNTNTAQTDATNSTFALSNVQSNYAGGYSVVVTNTVGAVTSVVATLTVSPAPTNGTFYVATDGNDTNPGTITEPLATIPKAVALAGPGATIYVRGGTHYYSSTIRIEHSGTAEAPIRLLAYTGEQPVINFTNQPYGAANRGILITTNGNWWEFKGLEVCYAGDNGIKVEGSHHRFEQCVLHHNGDTGLQIGFGHEATNPDGQLAAFITVVNCDSSYNYDSDSNGGDADGFAAKMHCGRGIVFMSCRSWYNSDDGYDLYETDYGIVISNCWTWKSAYVGQGNGNGFKLGGNGTGGDSKGTHCAYNCVAFGCKVNGFTQNSHKDGEVVVNCLGFSNGSSGYNFYFEGSLNSGKVNAFTNNASIPRSGTNTGGFIADNSPLEVNNSWNLSVTVNSADFADITEAAAGAARQSDGSLPTGFARLVAGSDLIDQGVNVGQLFNGTAPDLGPYEYAP
jgi:pectate disaccharide-lyase